LVTPFWWTEQVKNTNYEHRCSNWVEQKRTERTNKPLEDCHQCLFGEALEPKFSTEQCKMMQWR
jgi:hypothetical protein